MKNLPSETLLRPEAALDADLAWIPQSRHVHERLQGEEGRREWEHGGRGKAPWRSVWEILKFENRKNGSRTVLCRER